jgi:hypothetical protein
MLQNDRLRLAAARDLQEGTLDLDKLPFQYLKQLAAAEFQVLTRGVPFRMEEGFGAFRAAMAAAGRHIFWPCTGQGGNIGNHPAYYMSIVCDMFCFDVHVWIQCTSISIVLWCTCY